ncbi:MAG: methyltransferase domain-containing protein, partial [Actinomycetaceae bacterium]|nr:methyltransferase domain-containing protein [Actinomycetaceae bacterium]
MAPRRLLVASDWGELAGMRPTSDHVMPVGGATRTLATLADYQPGQRVLDIGTGCGIHAILAALCGARVTATDTSARALAYARFNARMAGVRLDLRQGSLLEPVLPSGDVQS